MSLLSKKLRKWVDPATGREGVSYACPHCGIHTIVTKGAGAWGWNGDVEKPVFTPSVLATRDLPTGREVCHSFVGYNGAQPGEVIFLADCTHELAGKIIPLPDLPDWMLDKE